MDAKELEQIFEIGRILNETNDDTIDIVNTDTFDDTKYKLITRDLSEIIGDDELKKKIKNNEELKVYWGTAPTGKIHIGYLYPMRKIADFVNAGCSVKILLADLHAFLDSKSDFEQLTHRTTYYQKVIESLLEIFHIDMSKVSFVIGSSFQLSPKYVLDMFKLGNICPINQAQKAGTEVVKQMKNPLITSLLYPLMQSLDEQYLDIDIELGGIDQRKLFAFSRDYVPKIGYKNKIYLMNPIISGLSTAQVTASESEEQAIFNQREMKCKTCGQQLELKEQKIEKMSASDANTKIDILDTPKDIRKKFSKVFCVEGEINGDYTLYLIKTLLFPILNDIKKKFFVNRPEKYGGNVTYMTYQEIENDFLDKKLYPADLKNAVSDILIDLLSGARQKFETLQNLVKNAYP